MKKYAVLLLAIFLLKSLSSQVKLNYALAKKMATPGMELLHVFVKGDVATIKELTQQTGGHFNYASGDIATIEIPATALSLFVSNSKITRIEAYPPHLKPMNDTMLINSNVIPVHTGQSPLPQAYTGRGVVLGFIDTGIDFTHPDFQDANGHTRIKYLWDQTQPNAANTPMPYNYGQEWDSTGINGGLAAAHTDLAFYGHGTHVIGVGAGNGRAVGNYKGVAPDAELVVVALDFYSSNSAVVSDAVNYIYEKANLLGEPCVINASLGDYYGSHDGKNLEAQLISSLIDAQPGRAFVTACGNGGTTPYHLGYTTSSDTNFTFFQSSGSISIPIYADTADLQNVYFSIGADEISPFHSFRGNIPFSRVTSHLGSIQYDTLKNGSNRLGVVESYGDLTAGVYSLEFTIHPDSSAYLWRLMTTGTGKFDSWTFDLYDGTLPGAASMPDSSKYKLSDTKETITNSFNCLDNVISVGNYTNRKTYIDYNGNTYVNTATDPGVLHPTSSRGPTRDGRIKPDICAPGDMTLAAVVLSMQADIIANYPDALALGGYHVRDGGTSHAAPGVAGIVALYLQRYPTASVPQIKNDLLCSAKRDGFTGSSLPDNNWGYGKANAFGTLVGCITTGNSDLTAQNTLDVYPNPGNGGTNIQVILNKTDAAKNDVLTVYNALGEEVWKQPIIRSESTIQLNLPTGIYFCRLLENNRPVLSKKIVIL